MTPDELWALPPLKLLLFSMSLKAAYTVNEMLDAYGIGKTKLYAEIKSGRLIARKLGTKTLFLAEDIAVWVETWPRMRMGQRMGQDFP